MKISCRENIPFFFFSFGHSHVYQVLLQIVVTAVIIPLHLLGPALPGCCKLQLTSISSVIVLQRSCLCEEWGGRFLCLSGDCSVLMDLHWPYDCTA